MPPRIAELLLRERLISPEQLREAEEAGRRTGGRVVSLLVEHGAIADRELAAFLSRHFGVPAISLEDLDIGEDVLRLVPRATAEKHHLLPVSRAGGSLVVAMSDPSNLFAIDDVQYFTGYKVDVVVAPDRAIADAIARWYPEAEPADAGDEGPVEMHRERIDDLGIDAASGGNAAEPAPATQSPILAYPLLVAPERVVSGAEFELAVGLSDAEVDGARGVVFLPRRDRLSVDVRVDAPDFTLREGEGWSFQLDVRPGAPCPARKLHLLASGPAADPQPLRAIYSVDGETVGLGLRLVRVVSRAGEVAPVPRQPAPAAIGAPSETKPDLQILITLRASDGGALRWGLDSPHADVRATLPRELLESDIGQSGAAFARSLVGKVRQREGKPGLYQAVLGVARTIAQSMPAPVRDAIRKTGEVVGRTPSVLILSQEPYIPWELAALEPRLDAGAPPFLSAQVDVGRWVFAPPSPPLPPPAAARGHPICAFWGSPGEPLPAAQLEAEGICRGSSEPCRIADMPGLLAWAREARGGVLHLAVHGRYDPGALEDGIALADSTYLDPMTVRGLDLSGGPFVFLNACQVALGSEVIGTYSGMGAAFLSAGAAGVVAPLWSVRDDLAGEIAAEFYAEVDRGVPPAAVLRAVHARFTESATCATPLAYQLFAHPRMRLTAS